jgi:hypothetical protein
MSRACSFCLVKHILEVKYPTDNICIICGSEELKKKLPKLLPIAAPLINIVIKFIDHKSIAMCIGATGSTGPAGDIRAVGPTGPAGPVSDFSHIKTFENYLIYFNMQHVPDIAKEQMRPFIEEAIKAHKK